MPMTGSYTDGQGTVHPNAYSEITPSNLDQVSRRGFSSACIWASEASFTSGYPYIGKRDYIFENSEGDMVYDDNFSEAILAELGVTPVTQTISLLLTYPEWAGWSAI